MAQPPQKPGAPGRPLAGSSDEEPEHRKKRYSADALADTCVALEEELEELKVKYEMYFLGTERLEPARRRDDLKRKIARIKTAFTRNTGLRFRIQALHARYLAYERLWLRAAREKEEGTYRRDLLKARMRRRAAAPDGAAAAPRRPADPDLSDWAVQVTPTPASEAVATALRAAPAPPAAAPAAPRPAAAAPAPAPRAALPEAQMRALYDAYVAAKQRCHEDTSRITYEAVARSVSKQIPDIMTRYKAKAVDFKVVIKDGKALLKAVPRS